MQIFVGDANIPSALFYNVREILEATVFLLRF